MYLDRRMWNDPLSIHLGDKERKVVEAVEDAPGKPITASQLEMDQASLRETVIRLRAKGFNIAAIHGAGAYYWDGRSR